jgi:LCP family protein required for cell wall assembly
VDGDDRPAPRAAGPVAAGDLAGEDGSWGGGAGEGRNGRAADGRAAGDGQPAAEGRERLAPVRFRPGQRRRWPRRILILANVVVGLLILTAAAGYGYFHVQLGRIGRTHFADLANVGGGQPFTMLLVGSDSRNIAGGSQFAQSGVNTASLGQRSDTIIVARVVPAARQITLMSIPRDLWVPIKGMGTNRVNAAFNNGPQLLVSTIEHDLRIPINHYAEVNFDTFKAIAQAVGGVHVWFPTPAKDVYSGLYMAPGCQLLNGIASLAFVRSRHYQYYTDGYWHSEAASDLAREQRQQYFLKRLADKAKGEFTNPVALNNIVSGITGNLVVDDKLSNGDLLALAKTFRGIGSSGIPSITLPTTPAVIDGNDVLQLAQPGAAQAIAAFNAFGNPQPKATTTTAKPATPTATAPANAPAPSTVAVHVVNGSGANGQAAKATSDLRQLGYQASTDTTSRAYVGASNVVRYAPDSQAAAEALATKLVGGAQLVADPSLTPSSYNLELDTGSSYSGLGAGKATTSSTAPPATAAPPASSATANATAAVAGYTLPGTPPGVTPPASCTP